MSSKGSNKTDAQRRAQNKYQAEHLTTLGVKVSKETADAFRAVCASHGKTVNAYLADYVLSEIGHPAAPEQPGGRTAPEQDAVIIPPHVLARARQGAEQAGSPIAAWLSEAVEKKIKTDEFSRKLNSLAPAAQNADERERKAAEQEK